jgi:DNA modification methylase
MEPTSIIVEDWPLERIHPFPGNPRKRSKHAVAKVAASIKEFGWRQPIVVDEAGIILVGHTRLDAAYFLKLATAPVHQALGLTEAQKVAYRLADNRTNEETTWDLPLLGIELKALQAFEFNLNLTGFNMGELNALTREGAVEGEDDVPAVQKLVITQPGDLWLLGPHRLLCGDATSPEAVARLLGERKPRLLVTDPPYGISLDSEWRDRAGLNGYGPAEPSYMKKRTPGHTETSISGDTRADWSEAFALVPSLEVGYIWHASLFTREVLNGLERIGFLYPQQIIWNKGRTVLTRTHYWYQHEPCWYVRKKHAPWYGKAGENATVWDSPSPKFIMGGSNEVKFDHPTQKPVELMRRPILNHTRRREVVYDAFLGSGTTLMAAELTERICVGMELDPKYCDVIVRRWQEFTGKLACLEDGETFDSRAASISPQVAKSETHKKQGRKATI